MNDLPMLPGCHFEGPTRYCDGPPSIPWYDQPWLIPALIIAVLVVLTYIAVRVNARQPQ